MRHCLHNDQTRPSCASWATSLRFVGRCPSAVGFSSPIRSTAYSCSYGGCTQGVFCIRTRRNGEQLNAPVVDGRAKETSLAGEDELRLWIADQRANTRPNVTPLTEPKKFMNIFFLINTTTQKELLMKCLLKSKY